MALATLSIDIEARMAKFEQGLDRAARAAEKQAEASRQAWARVGDNLAAVGKAAAGLFAGFSVVEFVRSNIDAIDSLNDMQDATGSTIEKLSGLSEAAQRTGHSQEDATALLVKLNAALNDTEEDSSTSRALRAIGVSADELRKADPVDALQEVARALGRYADDGSKARLVQELFGKSARELSPLLKDLADAGELNGKITSEQAEQADKFNKELAKLSTNISNAAKALTADLLPAMNSFADKTRDKGFGGALMDFLGFDDKLSQTKQIADAGARLRELGKERALLQEQLRADYTNADTDRRRERLKVVEQELAAEKELYKQRVAVIKGLAAAGDEDYSNEGRTVPKPSVGDVPSKTKTTVPKKAEIDEASQALAQYVEQLQRQIDAEANLTDIERGQQFLKSLGKTGEIQEVRDLVDELSKKITVSKQDAALAKIAAEEEKARTAELKDLNDEIDRFTGRTEEERKVKLTLQLEKRIQDGEVFTPEELDRAVKGIAGIKDGSKDSFDQIGEFAKQAARNIQDSLGDGLYRALKGDFGSILDGFGDMLLKMIAQAQAAQLAKALIGDIGATGQVGGLVGTIGSFVGSFFANGGAFGPSGRIKAFASGDVFDSPTAFAYGAGELGVMGEAGPEAVMPLKRGPDGRLGVSSSSQGGRTIVQIYNQGQEMSASASTSRQPNGDLLVKVMLEAVASDMATGGKTARAVQSRFNLKPY